MAWPDEAACAKVAEGVAGRLSRHAEVRNAVVELHGTLGAGKTTFVRHLLRALGVSGAIKSPTYALMEPYVAEGEHDGFAIWHFDFYRFDDPAEWEDAGFREVFAGPGLKLVEWPEKAAGLLPVADLAVTIVPREPRAGEREATPSHGDAENDDAPRDVRFEARSPVGVRLLP